MLYEVITGKTALVLLRILHLGDLFLIPFNTSVGTVIVDRFEVFRVHGIPGYIGIFFQPGGNVSNHVFNELGVIVSFLCDVLFVWPF